MTLIKALFIIYLVVYSLISYAQNDTITIPKKLKLYKINNVNLYNWDGSIINYIYLINDSTYINPYSQDTIFTSFKIHSKNLIEVNDTLIFKGNNPKVNPKVIAKVSNNKLKSVEDSTILLLSELDRLPKNKKIKNLIEYVNNNFQFFCKEECTQGVIFVQFIIEKDGSISNCTIIRGINERLDNEAIRVVESLPKWYPGMKENKPVRTYYVIPIKGLF